MTIGAMTVRYFLNFSNNRNMSRTLYLFLLWGAVCAICAEFWFGYKTDCIYRKGVAAGIEIGVSATIDTMSSITARQIRDIEYANRQMSGRVIIAATAIDGSTLDSTFISSLIEKNKNIDR